MSRSSSNQYKNTLWAIVIIFLILIAAVTFLTIFLSPGGVGGKGVRIAILDSGIDMNAKFTGVSASRELKDRIILSANFANTTYGFNEDYSDVDDTTSKHGTIIAIQIAGRSYGIAPEAELIIARCVDKDGSARYEAVLAAFRWAVDVAKADIVNISLGGGIIHNDTIVSEINRATLESGVLTVISAGNSGDGTKYTLTTINGPANALQGIAVGAYDINGITSYSSLGPLKDHSIKPDLVDSGFTLNVLGTSFAAPKIVAKAAVLMSWIKEQGFQTSPGLLKAALMKSAAVNQKFPEHYAGAGIPKVEEAKRLITLAPKINGLPIISYVIPTQIPFEIDVIFSGDVWSFPITIISPLQQSFTFSTSANSGTTIVDIPSHVIINQTGLVPCKFIVPNGYVFENHQEIITVTSESTESFTINVSLKKIAAPHLRIGFDVYHSAWEMDHLLGQFNQMRNFLADEKVSLIEFTSPDNYTDLADFDAIFLFDPNTYGNKFNESELIELYNQPFKNETISALVDFVNSGHGLFICTTDYQTSEYTETNRLLEYFNTSISTYTYPASADSSSSFQVVTVTNLTTSHPVMSGISSIDYHGAVLNLLGENAQGIGWANINTTPESEPTFSWLPVFVAFQSPVSAKGRVVISGSNFMVDNWGINNEYIANDNLEFLYNVVEWITNYTLGLSLNAPQTKSFHSSLPVNNVELDFGIQSQALIAQQNIMLFTTAAILTTVSQRKKCL